MNRRRFFKGIIAAGAGIIVSKIPRFLTEQQKKELAIAKALGTKEGREALAKSMVEPIRASLEYQAVGRKLLMVDELPQGALKRYERDVAAVANIVSRRS